MQSELRFSLEIVDGDRLGKLLVPFAQIANWLNLLTSPHYEIQIVHTEQVAHGVAIYFDACEAMYWYVSDRVNTESRYSSSSLMPLAS